MICTRLVLLAALMQGTVPLLARAESPNQSAASTPSISLFDPARHMRVSEVRPGMAGYGLTVFKGTTIQKFNVEVLAVLHNYFGPKSDAVLIRCKDDLLEHTGSIAGMSGSPVFLKDDQGRYRMIGAFAYGWPMTKDPIAGVQPIEYMLKLPAPKAPAQTASGSREVPVAKGEHSGLSWSLVNAGVAPFWKSMPIAARDEEESPRSAAPRLGTGEMPRLQPLATPLMASGLPSSLLKQIAPMFAAYGLSALQAGEGGSGDRQSAARIEPGSTLAVPLLTGDVDLTAVGTCTEVLGDRVFGFGHPFNNEGTVALPMGAGEVNGVIANLQTSFKLGAVTKVLGELTADESVGVAGEFGRSAPTVPIEFTISYADGRPAHSYHFHSALHPKFTPMIAGVALAAALTAPSDLPQYNTLDYDLKLHFSNGQTIDLANTAVNANMQELFAEIALPMIAASENPFQRVTIEKITGTVKISPEAREAQILEVNLPKSRYRPGETVKAYVTYKPFRGEEGILPVELELPRGMPQGQYQLVISDAQRYFQEEQQTQPFRFTADSIGDVFGVLKDVAAIRQNAVYLRLLRQPDGVAVGRVALPQLPSSRRQILLGAGRSNTTPYVSSTIKSIPTDMVMTGSAEFAITIDPLAKVEVAGPKGTKTEQPAASPKVNSEPHGKSAAPNADAASEPESKEQAKS